MKYSSGIYLTRQVVIINRFCIVYFTSLARPPFSFTSSAMNGLLSNQATTKLRCTLAITTINPHLNQSNSEMRISIESLRQF